MLAAFPPATRSRAPRIPDSSSRRRSSGHARFLVEVLFQGLPHLRPGAVEEATLYGAAGAQPSNSAEQVLLHLWVGEEIMAALKALPAHYQTAVLLSDVEGLSYAETAQAMGCAPGTVMSRLHRGRMLLRRAGWPRRRSRRPAGPAGPAWPTSSGRLRSTTTAARTSRTATS